MFVELFSKKAQSLEMESIIKIALWIIFLIVAGFALYIGLKKIIG